MEQLSNGAIKINSTGDVLLFKETLAITYHSDDAYQLFQTDEGCYIYDKTNEKIVQMSIWGWHKLLIKIVAVESNSCIIEPILN